MIKQRQRQPSRSRNAERRLPLRERETSQLEEARQLRDHLARCITLGKIGLTETVSLAMADAEAIEHLLTRSIDAADRMGAQ